MPDKRSSEETLDAEAPRVNKRRRVERCLGDHPMVLWRPGPGSHKPWDMRNQWVFLATPLGPEAPKGLIIVIHNP